MSDVVLGIDLGTTLSAMAYVDQSGRVVMIPNSEGETLTPSAVLVDGSRFEVGRVALSQAIARPGDVARWMKRNMGDADYRFQGKYTPEQISAEILRKLVNDATAHLSRSVTRAVITVPAYFTGLARRKTKDAADLVDLQVEDLLDEPEAAAIHFGIKNLREGERVLVCDLGGGTYDATVLRLTGGILGAERTRGAHELGGHDWTHCLGELIAERIVDAIGVDPRESPHSRQNLYELSERTKCALSALPETVVPWSEAGKSLQLRISRQEFEQRSAPLLQQVLQKTVQVIEDAKLSMNDIHHVLVVGGSSRLPSFVEGITQITGKALLKASNPDEIVARGAAVVAHGYASGSAVRGAGRITVGGSRGAGSGRITVQRRTAHALGTIVLDESRPGSPGLLNDAIIPENTDIPAMAERSEYYIRPGQTSFQVPVIELDSHGQLQAMLGNYHFGGAPERSVIAPIRVRFEYDGNKIPRVSAWDLLSGSQLEGVVADYREPDLRPQEIPTPTTVVLAIDCSSSMAGEKIEQARSALEEIAQTYLRGASQRSVAVVNFGGAHSIYPSRILLMPTQSLEAVRATTRQLVAEGDTPMDAGLQSVRQVLDSAPGRRLAIVLTDGQPNNVETSRQTAQTLRALQIQIGVVPIGSDANRDFLNSIKDFDSSIVVDDSGKGMAAAVLDILTKA